MKDPTNLVFSYSSRLYIPCISWISFRPSKEGPIYEFRLCQLKLLFTNFCIFERPLLAPIEGEEGTGPGGPRNRIRRADN